MWELCSIKKNTVGMLAHLLFLICLIMLFLSIQFDIEGKKYLNSFKMVSLFLTILFSCVLNKNLNKMSPHIWKHFALIYHDSRIHHALTHNMDYSAL